MENSFICEFPHNVDEMLIKCIGDSESNREHKPLSGREYSVELYDGTVLFLYDMTAFREDEANNNIKNQYDYMIELSHEEFYQLPMIFLPLTDIYYSQHIKAYYGRYEYEYFKRGELDLYKELVETGTFRFNYQNENYQEINVKVRDQCRNLLFERAFEGLEEVRNR